MEQKNCRLLGLDWIRCIATFMVILLHTSAITFVEFKEGWVVASFFDSFSRCAVPLFFMLSGFLLLNGKGENLKVFMTRRFLRIFVPFLILCAVYAFVKGWSLGQLLQKSLFQGPLDFHLWFIYSIIGIYLFLPIVETLFKTKSYEIIKYYLCLWFVSFILFQTLQRIFGFSVNPFQTFNFYYFQGYLGYVILGGWINVLFKDFFNGSSNKFFLKFLFRREKNRLNFISIFLYFFFSLLIFFGTFTHSVKSGRASELFFDYSNLLVFGQAVALFFSFVSIQGTCRGGVNKILFLSRYTYWIYLLHILCLGFVLNYIDILRLSSFSIPLASVLTFSLAFLFSIPLLYVENIILRWFRSFSFQRS